MMFKTPLFLFVYSLSSFVCSVDIAQAQLPQASVYDEETEDFLPYDARTLDSIDDYTTNAENLEFSHFGGWKERRAEATGFFRVEKIDGRWWAIDPQGYLYIHKAVNSVQLFGDYTNDDVYEDLPDYGMNGTGNWSDVSIQNSDLKDDTPLAYCPKYSFVSSYKSTRDDRLPIAVFDDEFVTFCEEKAESEFSRYVDDPHVFGYFIDNELSWTFTGGLESHLDVDDSSDKNYQAAVSFLADRNVDIDDFSDEDADDYAAVMAERYFSVVCSAVRAVDPNHMILGPRLNKSWNRTKEFMEAAGRYLDIVALNHYHRWGTRNNELENIAEWTDRPVLISEFYAMEKIPGYEEKGAGWRVEDETSRALFYENFLTTQLENPYVVGFHWFNFQDDYASDDSSQTIAKRGLIDIDGNSYTELQASMKYMNDRIYDYIDYVDGRQEPDVTITAEADAYFQDDENYGTGTELLVRRASDRYTRSAYVRFDAASVTEDVVSAKILLFGTSPEEKLTSSYGAELVLDNSWSETGINADNAPSGSTVLASWGHGDDIEIDVTEELTAALQGDAKLSIRIYDVLDNDLEVKYGAREYPDAYAQPKLVVYYEREEEEEEEVADYSKLTHLISSENFEDGFVVWNSSGSDSTLYTDTVNAHQGNNAAQLRDNSSQSRLVSDSMDLLDYTAVTVDFWYFAENMADGHDLWLQISTDGGTNYTTVETWIAGTDFDNGEFVRGAFTIDNMVLTSNTILRFKCDAQDNSNLIYLDEINVSATGRAALENYASWAAANLVESSDPFEDTDGDGIETIMEYVLNGDPSNGDFDILPAAEITDDHFIFSFSRLADSAQDTEQIFQYSSDLENWVDVNITEPKDSMVNLSLAVGGVQDVKIMVDKGVESDGKLFGRLKVVEP